MTPLSVPLQAALVGEQEMTQALMGEWAQKRPEEYRRHKIESIRRAVSGLAESQIAAILSTDKPLCYAKRS